MAFGNVNVKYKPCKSVGQLKSAEKYMLGKQLNQIKDGIIKTEPDLYTALGCNRDNFSNNILVTRKLHGKRYSKLNENEVLAHKMSISFHPDDRRTSGGKLTYKMAYEIAQQFAEKFIHEKGHEVLFAVHTDKPHVHVHFIISNCNIDTGKAYRRNKKDLYSMSKFFGEQCLEHGLENSVRDEFYNHDKDNMRDKITIAEKEMTKRGKETFKAELREVIQLEIQSSKNKTFDDVIKSLWENYNVETRVAGNTVSYRHPEYRNKNNELVSVRGSKLGDMYTRKGIEYELEKQSKARAEHANFVGEFEQTPQPSIDDERRIPQGSGGQIPSAVADSDIRGNEQGIDKFYERYRQPVEFDEQSAIEIVESAKRIRSKGAR